MPDSLASRLERLTVRRIAVIKPSALGDVVQSLPVLPALRARFPEALITWVINHELSQLVEGHPCVNDVLTFHRRGTAKQFLRLLRGLREREFDLVFDLQGLMRSGVMAAATRAPLRVGLETSREGSGWTCHLTLPGTDRTVPAFRRYWRIAEELGHGDSSPLTIVTTSDTDDRWATEQLATCPGPVIAIHPGARWITKRWPVEKFAVVTGKVLRQFGGSAIILGSSSEAPVARELEELLKAFAPRNTIRNLTGQTSIKQLAALLSRVDTVLTNDSGPMHLAAGLGTPVVGLFTCTSPLISGPLGDQHELVATQVSCAASYKKICPHAGCGHLCCLDELGPDRVFQALARLLDRTLAKRHAA